MSKLMVALFFGGCSGEHEVSLNSAYSVAQGLKENFNLFPIGIAKDGQWYGPIPVAQIPNFRPEEFQEQKITILPFPNSGGQIYSLPNLKKVTKADIFFPVLHGTYGEDGTIQGLLELAQVPYVGARVLASAAGMDKIIMKNIFAQANLPQVPYLGLSRTEIEKDSLSLKIEEKLGYPCFIKPANLGSSVGISKVKNRKELKQALKIAARYDRRIIVEKGVEAREFEISILGNDEPQASIPGEIVPGNEFYDYEAKYILNTSHLHIPANLPNEQVELMQKLAIRAYRALDCSGLARIDFFITKNTEEILINEINTLPGFTEISMYPKLWEHSGISKEDLLNKLIYLALEDYAEKSKTITSYQP